jgi:hypothetical protein
MSASAPKVFLVLEDGLDPRPIEEAFPRGTRIHPARLPDADHAPMPLGDAADAELVVVACESASERALELIKTARSHLQGRPTVIVRSRRGRTTSSHCPSPMQSSRSRSRRRWSDGAGRTSPAPGR